jgi:hypothetical protein
MRFVAGLFAAAVIGVIVWLAGAQLGHTIVQVWVTSWPILLPILLVLVCIGIGAAGSSIGYVGAVLFAIGGIASIVFLPYAAAHKYADSVKEVSSSIPNYEQRYPYGPATQSSQRNLQNVTGNAQFTKSLPGESEHGTWNTAIVRRGIGVGYEVVQTMDTPLYGEIKSSEVKLCYFDQNASLRLDGFLPVNNLARAINWATPANVDFDETDVYSYCDGKTPIVVVPLKQVSGFFGATWSAYGDAVYNGKTGQLSILTDSDEIAKLKGSVYPLTLAEDTRNAYQASGDIWAFWQGRSGYETSSSDSDDPNAGNDAEFNLREKDSSRTDFVSPLTPRGSSKNIVALGVVDARKVVPGTRNTLVIHRYAGEQIRQATSAVENNIKADYTLDGAWASGLTVFEIVPEANGNWVASIGKTQTVAYRAYIDAKGNTKLYDASGTLIAPIGSATETAPTGSDTGAPAANSDLSKLTPAQLQQLGTEILKELARRQAGGSTPSATPSATPTLTPSAVATPSVSASPVK